MNLEGGCSCGAIRYKLTESPMIVHACHCRDCQRVTGSGFVINIWIEREFVERTGATPKSVTLKGGTGKDHEAFFCDKCGTYVWSRYLVAPGDALFVRAGTLDNPDAVQPDVHIFTRSKLPIRRFHAMMLIDRGARGDREKARRLLGEAREIYTHIGMPRHIEMTRALLN